MASLTRYVALRDDEGVLHTFGPPDTIPDWAKSRIINPEAWDDNGVSANVFTQDPGDRLDYGYDWTQWLAGDTIATATIIAPNDLTVEDTAHTDTVVATWLSGGQPGMHHVTCRVVTAGARVGNRALRLLIRDDG